MVLPLIYWSKFDPTRKKMMRDRLEDILDSEAISKNLHEIVSKGLVVSGSDATSFMQ